MREPQHVTAIGNLAGYEEYNSLCFLALSIESGPTSEPSVATMLVSGSRRVQECRCCDVGGSLPREGIINILALAISRALSWFSRFKAVAAAVRDVEVPLGVLSLGNGVLFILAYST